MSDPTGTEPITSPESPFNAQLTARLLRPLQWGAVTQRLGGGILSRMQQTGASLPLLDGMLKRLHNADEAGSTQRPLVYARAQAAPDLAPHADTGAVMPVVVARPSVSSGAVGQVTNSFVHARPMVIARQVEPTQPMAYAAQATLQTSQSMNEPPILPANNRDLQETPIVQPISTPPTLPASDHIQQMSPTIPGASSRSITELARDSATFVLPIGRRVQRTQAAAPSSFPPNPQAPAHLAQSPVERIGAPVAASTIDPVAERSSTPAAATHITVRPIQLISNATAQLSPAPKASYVTVRPIQRAAEASAQVRPIRTTFTPTLAQPASGRRLGEGWGEGNCTASVRPLPKLVQRTPEAISAEAATPIVSETAPSAEGQHIKAQPPDVALVAEEVYGMLVRRLANERDRKGW